MNETDDETTDWSTCLALYRDLVGQARAARHRRLLWLSGEAPWCRALARRLLAEDGLPVLWCGGRPTQDLPAATAVPPERAQTMLGREFPRLVVDAFAGLDPDALGALSGTVSGGGIMCLLTPPARDWPAWPDPQRRRIAVAGWPEEAVGGRYLARLAHVLSADPHLLHIAQGAPPPAPPRATLAPPPRPADDPLCATADQARAVQAVVKTALGARRHPTVLTADRGRGKSAALGLAAARVLAAGRRRVLVSAPRPEAARGVFHHACAALPGARGKGLARSWSLPHGEAELRFMAPDALLRQRPAADLLLVDEAAAIPTPLLLDLARQWPRLAFATTVHGYEGSGRAFALRFTHLLERQSRGLRAVHLAEPVRWRADDPLEALIFRLLLLDAEPGPTPDPAAPPVAPEDRDRLAADEGRLGRLFGLLVNAHYRTRPADLRHLLDGPNLHVFAQGDLAACALLAEEGGFDAAFAAAVWRGERRPHGHLLPESLAVHLGLEHAPRRRGARVVRIAVHPRLQGRGLGSALLARLAQWAHARRLDYLGASFGATPELLRFWTANDCLPVRVSLGRSAASGMHSVLVMRPLNAAGEALVREARERFAENLAHALTDHLRRLDPELVDALLPGLPPPPGRPRPEEVAAYARHHRLLEAAMAPLAHAAWEALTQPALRARLSPPERHALILRLLQKHDWDHCAAALALPGRRQVDALLRQAFRRTLA